MMYYQPINDGEKEVSITNDLVARATADLQRAQRDAEMAASRLAKAKSDVADLEAFLRTLERYASAVTPAPAGVSNVEHAENGVKKWSSQPGTMARTLVDACIKRIQHAGKPQTIGELLSYLLDAGMTVGGADQKSNLAGYLSRDPRVASLGGRKGWIVKTEGTASTPGSQEAAPSTTEGESNDRPTLAFPVDETSS